MTTKDLDSGATLSPAAEDRATRRAGTRNASCERSTQGSILSMEDGSGSAAEPSNESEGPSRGPTGKEPEPIGKQSGLQPMPKRKIDWTNTLFIGAAHIAALVGLVWLIVNWHPATAVLGLVYFACCGLAITGGYHRLFAHRAYGARSPLRLFYLLFGAASVQNSALKWSADHRIHHAKVDTDDDPYNARRGFWWCHIGWVLVKDTREMDADSVKDLTRSRLIMLQHKHYLLLAIVWGALLPAAIGALWGDPIGGLLIAGFLRLVVQWHATFSVNSLAHMFGKQPYDVKGTARDSWVTAIVTLGEGYHNFHHRFQADYRNGVRWFQLDPTKWFVWSMSKVGVTRGLRRVPRQAIDRAREAVRNGSPKVEESVTS